VFRIETLQRGADSIAFAQRNRRDDELASIMGEFVKKIQFVPNHYFTVTLRQNDAGSR